MEETESVEVRFYRLLFEKYAKNEKERERERDAWVFFSFCFSFFAVVSYMLILVCSAHSCMPFIFNLTEISRLCNIDS